MPPLGGSRGARLRRAEAQRGHAPEAGEGAEAAGGFDAQDVAR